MQGNPTKHMFLSYVQPKGIMTTLVILTVVLVAFYFYVGRMNFLLWVLTAGTVICVRADVDQVVRSRTLYHP